MRQSNSEQFSQQTTPNEAVITLRNLKKSFGIKEVLSDLCMDLYKGENLVVLGKSGSGKSVSIKCMVGLLTQDAGSLRIFEQE
jgi:phospholipid/cholesterol/gamma-HCH transport system ATP-binding protein